MMTSPGNSTRIKTRLRNATFLARNSKGRQRNHNNNTMNNNHHRNNNRTCSNNTSTLKNNNGVGGNSVRQMNNINKTIIGHRRQADNNGNTSLVRNNVNGTYKGKFAR